ncbi:MAG: helix-turn-helix domain-containing protein [Microbacteriaceae bacterium]
MSNSADPAGGEDNTSQPERADRSIDLESLKALAHPLRVQILDILSQYGPATASGLAVRMGESSGATSYHLRQLERHGFVREIEGKGTARERWWRRSPGSLKLEITELSQTQTGRIAAATVQRQWNTNREILLRQFAEHSLDVLPEHWITASQISTANVRLTADQLKELGEEWMRFTDRYLETLRNQDESVPGSRPVQIQFNAFPLIDGEETPE